jgi:RNA polymerase sigma-70 factor, ECF subfamily
MSSEAAYFPDAFPNTREVREAICADPENEREALQEPAQEMVQAPEPSDEWLMEGVRRGEREALSPLFRRYARSIRNVAFRILRDEEEADDLVQEVFLFVFHKASLFDPARGSARSWLVQVAYHRAFDRRRHLRSRGFYAHLELEEAILRAEEPQAEVVSYEGTIEAAIGQNALRRIEESLSEVQRTVLRLRFLDGNTFEEIGIILGQPTGNVRNHYYRALEKMRKEVFAAQLQRK